MRKRSVPSGRGRIPRGTRVKPKAPPQSSVRRLTILAQDPSLREKNGRILTANVEVPNEQLSAGPRGYRVQVIDYDASTNRMYEPLDADRMGTIEEPVDPYAPRRKTSAAAFNARLLDDPRFHAQNAYAIVMRTLAHFERALGRRVSWSFGGHQLKVAPHAFADANAFYSPRMEALLFGYFAGPNGPVFTSLSHDIVAHETAHALLDGLRRRYLEPSSPDQAAFHEGFADVVALLSIFSIPEVVRYAIQAAVAPPRGRNMQLAQLTIAALKRGVLLGLGDQFGEELSGVHGASLRRSADIEPSPDLLDTPEFKEEHRRGEILVAAMLQTFLRIYEARLVDLKETSRNQLPLARVVEEGADIAERMLTMAIRALDYMPPTDIEFGDYLSALITSDLEIHPEDRRYGMRKHLLEGFKSFGIRPTSNHGEEGRWEPPLTLSTRAGRAAGKPRSLNYAVVHRDAMQHDRDEVFRFLWENRKALGLCEEAYTELGSVLPCLRIDQDGFTLRETVADYVQILVLPAGRIEALKIPGRRERIRLPKRVPERMPIRLLGGGSLIFDEFGQLKFHIRNALLNPARQTRRLRHLLGAGIFDGGEVGADRFATLHRKGMRPTMPRFRTERRQWP